MTNCDQAARAYISALLNDEPTNGSTPTFDDLGPWAEPAEAIKIAYEADHAAGARRAFNALAKNDQALAELIANHTNGGDPVFKRLSLTELMQRPPKEWLINDLIGKRDLAMIFGDAGSYKSLVVIEFIVAAAQGRPAADRFSTPRPLRIAYCAGEGIAGLPGRFIAAVNKYQVTPEDIPIDIYTDVPQLYDPQNEHNIFTFVNELSAQFSEAGKQLDLLVIDTMHTAAVGADENHAKDMGVILQSMKHTRERLGCTVLLVHHANRAGGYRGSSALHGAMDTMLQTKADGDGYGKLECFKQKDAEKFKPLHFMIRPDHYSQSVYVEWGETVSLNDEPPAKEKAKKAIVELLQKREGLNQSQIIRQLAEEAGKNSILEALHELEKLGQVETTRGPNNSIVYQLRLPDID